MRKPHLSYVGPILTALWLVTIGTGGTLAGVPDCPPVALGGMDWDAAVAAREAACNSVAHARSLAGSRRLTAIAIFDPAVQFAFASAALLPEAIASLDQLAEHLRSEAGNHRTVQVEGHTDAHGPDDLNRALSERRAEVVRLYLVARGVASGRLQSIGFGKTRPLPGVDPYDGANRRVQFRLSAEP